jgi:monoamine oxidase
VPSPDLDVVIVGAGAAGLAAARELECAGLKVCCLEARDRIGGRILTVCDPLTAVPIEMGAEFIHGRPREIFDVIQAGSLAICEVSGRAVGGGDSSRVIEDIQRLASQEHDEPLLDFLNRGDYSAGERSAALGYLEGFNAARAQRIGVASLAQDKRAAEAIDGDRSFRFLGGYRSLLVVSGVPPVRLNSIVESVEWRRGAATVHFRSGLTGDRESLRTGRVIVTVPLGVLQAGSILFDPHPAGILGAARALDFGNAYRVTLRFDRAFWQDDPETAGAVFLFSEEPVFPTWWTTLPVESTVITGWTAGPKADALMGKTRAEILTAALASLGRIVHVPPARLQNAWFHDWQADPFSRGAYSYVPAGQLGARRTLAEPVEATLYFAGEATDLVGYGGTVHGAIASGRRAVAQVLADRQPVNDAFAQSPRHRL